MGVFFAVLLILAALILLYILWCLAEPFFLVNDKVSLKRTELTDGEISKETVKKLPFVPNGSESSPDLRIFFFSDIHTEWCPVTAKRLCKSIKRAHEASGLDAVIFGGDIITYPENAAKGYTIPTNTQTIMHMGRGAMSKLHSITHPMASVT